MYQRYSSVFILVLFLFMQGCGSDNNSTSGNKTTGSVSVSLTDAPAFGFDHVWVTVRDLWFHSSDGAEPGHDGWIKFPLSSPVTFDLLTLGNGTISVPVWENIEVPEGDYTQIRVFLVRTQAPLADSASDEHLSYNNQVDVTGDATAYPLLVPDAERGIRLTGQFQVKKNEKLKLAIDFDAGHDVVKIDHENKTHYVLKPRLAYFDLQNAGAIVGRIDAAAAANNPSAHFVIKAEQAVPGGAVHVVRRVTVLADHTGRFVLFPLLPGMYDLVLRGINYQTTIIKNVPVTKGTTPQSNPTLVPAITMAPAVSPDYPIAATIVSPTGSWVDFYQTLPGAEEVPYEIRFRHFNPLTGQFRNFLMSSDSLQVATFNTSTITLSPATPVEGNGGYKAFSGAMLHNHSDAVLVTSATQTVAFSTLAVSLPATSRSVSGTITVPETFAPGFLDRGVLFASHGGMIVNAINVDSQMVSGGTFTISNLPGGTTAQPLPRAFYGIDAFGWSVTNPLNKATATPAFVNLTSDDASGVDLTMTILP